eukprot:7077533-Pyramimonas_sp.AAC.1
MEHPVGCRVSDGLTLLRERAEILSGGDSKLPQRPRARLRSCPDGTVTPARDRLSLAPPRPWGLPAGPEH